MNLQQKMDLTLWLPSPLLISMAAIGVLPLELIWAVDYFTKLLTAQTLLGIVDYMFDEKYSLLLRSFSFFHLVMPFIWLRYLMKWGYDKRAFSYQIFLTVIILLLTYFFTNPKENINWVFMPQAQGWEHIPQTLWLIFLIISFAIFLFFPLHKLYQTLFNESPLR